MTDEHVKEILPYNKVVTTIETETKANQAVAALTAAGVSEENITLYHGKQAEQFLDLDGSQSGFFFKLVRRYQRLQGLEKKMMDEGEAALKAGHYLLGVQTDGSHEQQIQARDAMKPYTANYIYFCGHIAITVLAIGEG